jgi:hypothetical protein
MRGIGQGVRSFICPMRLDSRSDARRMIDEHADTPSSLGPYSGSCPGARLGVGISASNCRVPQSPTEP